MKFAVMIPGPILRRWQVEVIQKLESIPGVRCTLLIVDGRTSERGRIGRYRRQPWRMYPWLLYLRLVRRKVPAIQPVVLPDRLNEVERITCTVTAKGKYSEIFSDADVDAIRSHDPDFILRFGFGIIRGAILTAARYGVWSFHHGDEQKFRGSPPGFWEVYRGENVTGAILQRLTGRLDAGVILRKGWVRTKLNYPRNLDQILRASTSWPSSVCRELMENPERLTELTPAETSAPILRTPGPAHLALYGIRSIMRTLRTLFRTLLFTDVWNIGVLHAPISDFIDRAPERASIDWYPRDRACFLADPFVLDDGNGDRVRILTEVFPFERGRGEIGLVDFDRNSRRFSEVGTVLREKHHLSYPWVVPGTEGNVVVEAHRTGTIPLYSLSSDASKLTYKSTLIDNCAGIDATLIHHAGLWWMFTTDKADGPHHHLKVFFAHTVEGPWTPHPLNPVKTDIRSARPACTPFYHDGKLHRPAMDYSEKVEGRVTINRIDVLTTTAFSETSVQTVEPFTDSPYPDKVHTLTKCGDLTVIDGCREELVLRSVPLLRYKFRILRALILRRSEFE